MRLEGAAIMNLGSGPLPGNGSLAPTLTTEYWEDVFAEEDPWDYGSSAYEHWKFDQTLALLPERRLARALELGCAEGYLSRRLAPRVGQLTAVDISPTAIDRARTRCAGLANVRCGVLNLASDPLPTNLDLILCSEVLFYLPAEMLEAAAAKIAASLKRGGYLLLAHGNVIADDRTRTGFDWGHPFGAKTIGKVFAALDRLALIKELRTPLFTAQLFRRTAGAKQPAAAPEISEIPLPPTLVLTPEVEKTILWDGAATTRAEAHARETTTAVPILMYHSVADDGPAELAPYRISPSRFREQLRYLRHHGYHSVTLAQWGECLAARRALPGRPVILTFDDGYKDFIENAWPILERADFGATLFVVTEKVGGVADWDPAASRPLPLMSWHDLRELEAKGVEIGSHSASHQDFSAISADRVTAEGRQARARLREELGKEASIIAFPWGRADEAVRRSLACCGYTLGLTTWGGHSTLGDDPMNLPRIEIFGDDDIATFAGKLRPDTAGSAADGASPDGEPADGAIPSIGFESAVPSSGSKTSDVPERMPVPRIASFADERKAAVPRTRADHPQGLSEAIAAAAEIIGFGTIPAGRTDRPVHPDYLRTLGARLDLLIGEFVKFQTQLLNSLGGPISLQKRLTTLFSQPVTGRVGRAAVPGEEISPGIVLSFAEDARVTVTIEPKPDHTLSPDSYLNKVALALSGTSEWLELRVAADWSDLAMAERFQLCFYAQPSRSVACHALLRLPRKSGDPLDLGFASFELHSDERNAILTGDLRLPDFIELDTSRNPTLIVSFGTENEMSIVLHYINLYFA
jgi:peptidoglycan/xylan/chitin deacetylase (PgdA/CDA1 family)/SAM-dependent methyltransferase